MSAHRTISFDTSAERRHWGPIPAADRPQLLETVRAGANTACVDCGDVPVDGGLRCYPCFRVCCEAKDRVVHGTQRAVSRHRRDGESLCDPCRVFERDRKRAARRKVAA